MKIFSFDAETNGLYGQAFMIAAIVIDKDGNETAKFVGRCPIEGSVDPWVRDNVLPKVSDVKETHSSYAALLEEFYKFYKVNKDDADVIAHMAFPVEAKVVRDMLTASPGREWDGPYPLIDVAGVLKGKGADPTSVDNYNTKHALTIPFHGVAHHPLYDSWAAAVCYSHLMESPSPQPAISRSQSPSHLKAQPK